MAAGSTIAIASLAVAAGGLAISLAIAYIKEKTDSAKRNGEMGRDIRYCSDSIKKLEGLPQKIEELKGNIQIVDDRLNGLPDKVEKLREVLQVFQDICPAYLHRHSASVGCEDKTNPK